MENLRDFVKGYFEDNKQIILDEIAQLVSIPSVNEGSYDGNIKKVLEAGGALAEKYGYNVEIKEKYVVAKFGTGAKKVGIFAHLDVVPVEASDWQVTEPFKMLEKDGFLFGRGVEDNKQAAVFACHFPDMIKQSGIPFDAQLVLYLGGNEETGMDDIEEFAKTEQMPDISIVPDNAFPVCVGEKTLIGVDLVAKTPFDSIENIEGGAASNIMLGKIEAMLKNGGKVSAEGLSAHAAYPEGSVNAGAVLYGKLMENPAVSENDKKILAVAKMFTEKYYGEVFGFEGEEEGFGKNTGVNGIVKTVDGKLSLNFDIRCGVETDSDELLEKVREKAEENGFELVVSRNNKGFKNPVTPLVEKFVEIYCKVSGIEKASLYFSGGGTYARKLKNAYSVGTSVPLGEENGLPAGHGGAHQPDECISVKGMFMGAEIVFEMVIEASK